MTWSARILVLAGLASVAFLSCSDDSSTNTSNSSRYATACQKIVDDTYNLTFVGSDSAVAIRPERADTTYACGFNNSTIATPTTVPADTLNYRYHLVNNNSLELMEGSLEVIYKTYLSAILGVNMDSIDLYAVYVRQGGGSGLNGVWHIDSVTYEAQRALNIIEKAVLDSMARSLSAADSANDSEFIEIRGDKITSFHTWSAADAFMDEWAGDSAGYDIIAQTLNDCEVRLTGGISGETVTISSDGEGNVIYQSSNEVDMPDYTHYDGNPRSCPNADYPPWWQTFLDHNARP